MIRVAPLPLAFTRDEILAARATDADMVARARTRLERHGASRALALLDGLGPEELTVLAGRERAATPAERAALYDRLRRQAVGRASATRRRAIPDRADLNRRRRMASYWADPERGRAAERARYVEDPEKHRARKVAFRARAS